MYYADIKNVDVANGPGIRVSLFVSGCTHHCKDCFNPESWDFNYGKPFDEEAAGKMMALLEPSHVRGLSLLGGEPFAPENQAAVLAFVRQVREKFPLKDIWCWTGYLYEELAAGKIGEHSRELLTQLDVLVDETVTAAQVQQVMEQAPVKVILENVSLFDVYRGKGIPEGKKSMAYSYTLRAEDRTLTDEDISGAMEALVKALRARLGAELRG